jgi:hypothetical protein
MASINASTSGPGGIITSGDTSGNLELQSGGSAIATVSSTGLSLASAKTLSVDGLNISPYAMKNRIINGGMDIAQRGNTFTSTSSANNDDTYVLDRFYILSDGNDAIDVTQTTTVPTGAKYSIGLDVETINKKFGIAQIIENANCFDVIGGDVTVSFQAKVSSTTKLDNIKCAIVAWSGTADTVTSDIISAWEAEGTNPTLIANATYENTPANLNVTTSFATYSVTATVDTASTSNLILFIWSDVTDTTLGDFLYITNVQLEKGSTATPFERRLYNQELANCQRYFQTVANGPSGASNLTTSCLFGFQFPVVMRTAPSSAVTGAIRVSDISTSAFTQSSGTIANNLVTPDGGSFILGNFTGMTINRPILLAQSSTGTIQLSAEL